MVTNQRKPTNQELETYINDVKIRLSWYTVGIVRIEQDHRYDNLLGSGTLVSLDSNYAILTAQHVVEEIKNATEFGLCISQDMHRLIWQKDHTDIIEVGRPNPTCPEKGPDIALIKLFGDKIGTVKAHKSFYDLAHILDGGKIKPLNYDAGLFLDGFVGELTTDEPPKQGFRAIRGFSMLTGAVGMADKHWKTDDFDFCEVTAKCDRDNPNNYEGMSGGGLWKVFAKETDTGTYEVEDTILCGVAYWQTDIEKNKRHIICHGYESIYGPIFEALTRVA